MATPPSLLGRAVLPLAQHNALSFSMERDRHSEHRELFLSFPTESTPFFVACFSHELHQFSTGTTGVLPAFLLAMAHL